MSDHWDFYFCRVDGAPASIFLDLGIARDAPVRDLSFVAHVRVRMRAPRPDGLSSQEEFDELARLDDHVATTLDRGGSTMYVGRCTSGGYRDLYFYVATGAGFESRVASAMVEFGSYEYSTGFRPDSEWRTYFEFLYPDAEA